MGSVAAPARRVLSGRIMSDRAHRHLVLLLTGAPGVRRDD
ncbi:hypothetical protein FHS55_002494 [Angulomicrobium tetraedrale]|uniref:Uncharacterized protein n=1 Tax=Ancylobacter tetraedralis TaxID=217068 RepID=A0A839ZAY7_9HYPH|nr:hypothetical protein [Ancylobacter tetraedralis]